MNLIKLFFPSSNPHNWIETISGKFIYPLDPDPDAIDIDDIAHALSMNCRFTGHVLRHYSVCEHSFYVSELCKPEHKLWGLLHDASEAYLSDIASPVKKSKNFFFYRRVEKRLQDCIYKKFGLLGNLPPEVKEIDWRMCCTEHKHLMNKSKRLWDNYKPYADFHITLREQSPMLNKEFFLALFRDLYEG